MELDLIKLELFRLGLDAELPPGLPPGAEKIEKCIAAGDGWGVFCLFHANLDLCKQPLALSQLVSALHLMGGYRYVTYLLEHVESTELANLRLLVGWSGSPFPVVRRYLNTYPHELVRACRRLKEELFSEGLSDQEVRLLTALETFIYVEPDSFGEEVSPAWLEIRQSAEERRNLHAGWYEWPTALETSKHGYVINNLCAGWFTYHRSAPGPAVAWLRRQIQEPGCHILVFKRAVRGLLRHRSPLLMLRALVMYLRYSYLFTKVIHSVLKHSEDIPRSAPK